MNLISFLVDFCSCGGVTLDDTLSSIIKTVYNVIRIGIPLILIVVGMIDMGKAITQQKEDDIKKAQGLLVKKAIAAALVFLIPSITTMLVGAISGNDKDSLSGCIDCLFNGNTNVTADKGTCASKPNASGNGHEEDTTQRNCKNGFTPHVDTTNGGCVCQ